MGAHADGPKQYADLGGETVLGRACRAFLHHPAVDWVQVVIHADDPALYATAVGTHEKLLPPVTGGATRQASVLNGLEALAALEAPPQTVLIHDAARPMVDAAVIDATLAGIGRSIGALPAIAVPDTVKRGQAASDGTLDIDIVQTIDRQGLYLAQTPQGFRLEEILSAHRRARAEGRDDFTDDSAVAEWAGLTVRLVAGNADNFKITTASDLKKARDMIGLPSFPKAPDIRTATGYDVHRTVPGGPVMLCGVAIDSDIRLDGHSDADVGLHALTDALLGTIGDGDIGSHFPPSDPQWKGVASDRFLAHACALVRARGGIINHLDVTIICEKPKIGPHRAAMRAAIAGICDIAADRVSVKATTHERIGTLGRGEGIAALATATIVIDTVDRDDSATERP
ncbi:MAG: bifunctional 2-C-methyl-D-erythritol 4-phosphate cytidylyltransferase/2-C-methyl-D-erythritol 2,4-cyclodiphosphate synthase [Nitratireductor sp.]|nr:bifunctional 2-C-methyl-D-erythritol 4-phosphate cytidylyltransferase/2-C-methyl-D-erythritol 2,4-cyclodiphosphate synthase [Nitratireductor sp.]